MDSPNRPRNHEVDELRGAAALLVLFYHSVHSGAAAIGIDWCIAPQLARQMTNNSITLQGNFDPSKLLAPIPEIRKSVKEMITAFGKQRYIANLGHGILPNVPVDHAKAFVDAVKEL